MMTKLLALASALVALGSSAATTYYNLLPDYSGKREVEGIATVTNRSCHGFFWRGGWFPHNFRERQAFMPGPGLFLQVGRDCRRFDRCGDVRF